MQNEQAFCPLCSLPLTTAGNHQICSLGCGHIFGFSCIDSYFALHSQCPLCKKAMHQKDIQLLFWDVSIPTPSDELTSLQLQTDNLYRDYQNKKKQIESVEAELAQTRDSLAKIISPATYQRIERIEEVIGHPALIFERKIENGSKVESFEDKIAWTAKADGKYGVESIRVGTPYMISEFLPLHSMPIRGFAMNEHSLITGSLDKTISICSLIHDCKLNAKVDVGFSVWDCSFFDSNLVLIGGEKGNFCGIDTRSTDISFRMNIGGPPIHSVESMNDSAIIAMSYSNSTFYDIRANRIINVPRPASSYFSLSKVQVRQYIGLCQGPQNSINLTLSKADAGQGFTILNTIKIPNLKVITKPATLVRDYKTYVAVPVEGSFSLFEIGNPHVDLSHSWKNKFPLSEGQTLDVALSYTDSMHLATISSNSVRVFDIP